MELTPYEIAMLSGGFGIAGVLLGAIVSYRFALHVASVSFDNAIRISNIDCRKEAAAHLRAAFAPYLAAARVDQCISAIDLQRLLEPGVNSLAVEMEKFRFYINPEDIADYEDACEKYQRIARIRAMNYFDGFDGMEPFKVFEKTVFAVLHFATPNSAFERDAPKAARPSTLRYASYWRSK